MGRVPGARPRGRIEQAQHDYACKPPGSNNARFSPTFAPLAASPIVQRLDKRKENEAKGGVSREHRVARERVILHIKSC